METRTVLRSLTLGATCGLRSMTGPAVMRWRLGDPVRLALAGFAVGELIADKLPSTPARTIAPALLFRALAGAYAGRSLALAAGGSGGAGAVAGACGAIVASYTGMALRAAVVRTANLPDFVVALGEDTLAIAAAISVTRG